MISTVIAWGTETVKVKDASPRDLSQWIMKDNSEDSVKISLQL